MKLACSVAVGNRLQSTVNHNKRHASSTLALCKNLKSTTYYILLFCPQYKNGNKYQLENLSKVLSRFVNEGKATIQFNSPPHDLYIQADPILLKSFLCLLRRTLENKLSEKDQVCCSMSITATPVKPAVKKLVIVKRSDYPDKGFPRTLEILHINNIKRSSLDKGILQLSKLRLLDVSHNNIEYLPSELSSLPSLSELNVSHNEFGKGTLKQWLWVGGYLCKTLKILDISNNTLNFLPYSLIKLQSLISLHIDHNLIQSLPSGIGSLKHLKFFTASNNLISVLPGSIKKLRLQNLDLSNNNFQNNQHSNPAAIFPKPLPVRTLKEYAARCVLYLQLPYAIGALPQTVIQFLDSTNYCVCGQACFNIFIRQNQMLLLTSIAQTFYVSSDDLIYVPVDCYFCTLKCFGSAHHNRVRQPVI
ncbi:hypothetical protein RN001_001494 [Aquatica leii]|uniref:PIF1/LRR1 pleckstrin homology domain-containing protein n=1 Tax=Aquatica leii TaxID=1421715 RepID=A0AAN7SQX7_9COLE|nr:hypothetical protein RN001_001494 [Aquatica leii]